jgi:hypothetical protein
VNPFRDLVKELLADIGRPDSDEVHEDGKAVHILRAATIEEERRARRVIARNAAPRPRLVYVGRPIVS